MTIQQKHASMTTMRFTVTVVRRVLRRDGALSIQRPREEAKRMSARLVVIPLRYRLEVWLLSMIELTYIQEAALKPSGNAAAVKRTYNYQNRCRLHRMGSLTEANSYDLAFHVERR